ATKEAAEAMEKTASATREKEALAVKVSGLEGELSKSIAKVVSMEKAEGVSSDVSKRLQVRLESLSAENQTLAAAVKSGADKLEASEKSLAKALSAQAELAGDLATQTGKVGLLGTRLETAENTAKQVASLTTALRKEKGRVQELTTRSTEREKMLKTTRKTLSESESKVKEMQRVVAFAEAADVDKMRKEIAAGKTMAVGSTKKIEGLKLQLLARTETEKRLIAERNKRLDEERAVRSRKREREKKLHGYLKAGSAAEKSKDTRQAVFSFKKVLEMEPDNADAHARIGLILAETPGKDSEAEQYLKRALELDPNHADVIFRLGYVQIRQEKMAEAAATMMRGSALEPKRADYRRYQGISFRSLGWVAAAESAFKDAFKLDSKNPETAYNLAVLLATLDEPRLTEAKEWYQKSLALGGQPNKRFEGFFKAN
ncbi:MAG: tetratricopeptide repeat protein, partial [Lentisphaeria bacterium]|nr:tetratricopeptide repeat protein [Lentisphaeria bacterium]